MLKNERNNTSEECEVKLINLYPEEDLSGMRIDKYLADELDDYSRSYLSKLIDEGRVLVGTEDSQKTVKASYKLRSGDAVQIEIPAPQIPDIVPEDISLDIVYEDDDVIIINKPQGMVVHPAPGNYSGTLVNGIMYHCQDNLSTINGVLRPGIVHRIDKNTSGLLVICKNDNAHRALAEQFAVHSITRIYTAIAYNYFKEDSITVNKAIARDKKDRKKMAIDPSGRRAVTHVSVTEKLRDGFSLIQCRLETGRTHQIRVHLSSINHPILGDDVYGPKKCPYNLSGQLLHAGTLGFIHPTTKEYVEFTADLPDYFENILDKLRVE
jgi:23S rRNA pseudouridine1911/1915/1917 synthase